MKKKIYIYVFIIIIFQWIFLSQANSSTCRPAWNWNWTVTSSCTWPSWYKVYWNIYVWTNTITMWTNSIMWIDLSVNKITFWATNWKILLDPTARINNSVSSRYYIAMSFTSNSWITSCPSWMYAFYQTSAPTTTSWYRIMNSTSTSSWNSKYPNSWKTEWTEINSNPWTSWTLYCWTRWS